MVVGCCLRTFQDVGPLWPTFLVVGVSLGRVQAPGHCRAERGSVRALPSVGLTAPGNDSHARVRMVPGWGEKTASMPCSYRVAQG